MSESKRCPQCQAEIPAGSPEGLCPQCLLQVGLEPKTADAPAQTAAYSPSGSGFVPPTPEVLQAAFPQLEILELLGKGGMGAVYKARQPGLDRLVAVKILPPEVSRDPMFIERFTREARALAKLSHPNIVAVFDFGQASSFCYFVMEYIDGVNLRQAMRAGELKAAQALKIVPQICDALQFAHDEGIVHRDIKPENILLDKKGRVKIADFGLAKLLGKAAPDVSLTGTQQVMGTMHYMAPEQLEGSRDVDHRADIYSLGVTFYEMLTGELPIGRFAAPSKKVQIDVRLDEVVLRSLEKEPEQRYQHASEIKTDVETIVRGPAAQQIAEGLEPSEVSPALDEDSTRVGFLRFVVLPMFLLAGIYSFVQISVYWRNEFVVEKGYFLLMLMALWLSVLWLFQRICARRLLGRVRTVRSTSTTLAWTGVCIYLYTLLWSPVEPPMAGGPSQNWPYLGDGYLDREVWPHSREKLQVVSLEPKFAGSEKLYRRVVLTQRRVYVGSARNLASFPSQITMPIHEIQLELEKINGEQQRILINAAENWSYEFPGEERRPLFDVAAASGWIDRSILSKEDGKNDIAKAIGLQAQFLVNLIRSPMQRDTREEPLRGTAQDLLDSTAPAWPFAILGSSEKESFSSSNMAIRYAGMPLMLVAWGIGLGLILWSRRPRKRPLSETARGPQEKKFL